MKIEMITERLKIESTYHARAAIREFLARVEGKKPGTRRNYRSALMRLVSWSNGRTIDNPTICSGFRRHLFASMKPCSANAMMLSVRLLYRMLNKYKCIDFDPDEILFREKLSDFHRRPTFTDQHVASMFRVCEGENEQDARISAYMALGFWGGLRASEILSIDASDLRVEGGKPVVYVQGKGHIEHDDFVILNDHVMDLIGRYLRIRNSIGDGSLIQTVTGHRITYSAILSEWHKVLKNAGLFGRGYTIHCMRHTAATKAIEGGASVEQVQQMLRHRDVNTTMIYVHQRNRMTDCAEARINYKIPA